MLLPLNAKTFLYSALMLMVLSTFPSLAQTTSVVDIDRLPNKKICKLLAKQKVVCRDDLQQVHGQCYSAADSLDFLTHYKSFVIESDPETVWDAYNNVQPAVAWNCKVARFGFLYNKRKDQLTYPDDKFEGLEEGQIFYINLNFLKFINVAVGSEVKVINPEDKKIGFCYLESGKSRGSQWIQLSETPQGHTLVEHYTRYKSDSPFRDSKLYPWLHGLVISHFHENIKYIVEHTEPEMLARKN